MKRSAVRTASMAAMVGAFMVAGNSAWAQVKPGSERGLGLTGADIPPLLQTIEADPYQLPAPLNCSGVGDELTTLNDLLGPDIDAEPVVADTKTNLASKGANLARGLVPYGGVVRFVTGASGKDKALQKAVLAGYARRGFLRGLQALPRCGETPAPPPPPAPHQKPRR
ncbi:hypothetical protein [Phenylobacterium sp.]|uniref:hypothetical protein n=1 Tax=Phenylobacterium sp. TaxID=1871053 RepID=UPI0011FA8B6A|nr:hypothetical protein [Phenylobacterium sp.]THD60313.1 MAG: hypothetical protein E8A12_10735 [Phenylobacterium sp.]